MGKMIKPPTTTCQRERCCKLDDSEVSIVCIPSYGKRFVAFIIYQFLSL